MIFMHSDEITEKYPKNFTMIAGNVTKIETAVLAQQSALLMQTARDNETRTVAAIQEWKKVFSIMGAKPKYCSSLESLKKSFDSGGHLYKINPVVDFYNAYSLSKGVPMAAYDQEKIVGTLVLRPARKDEIFIPLGNPKQMEKTKNNEVIYADEEKVICRYWNLQDCHNTRITDETKKIIFIFDIMSDTALNAEEKFAQIKTDFIRIFGDDISFGLTGPTIGLTI